MLIILRDDDDDDDDDLLLTGSCTVRWENKTMYCIVNVFGLAIN